MTKPLMERLPGPGWARLPTPPGLSGSTSAWSDGRAAVISSLVDAKAPDATEDIIPQWHISVTERGKRPSERVLRRALRAFGMSDAEEDNHHPGNARHFWLPVDPARRTGCECKVTETTEREPDGYTWTNPTDGPCRGCELERALGKPCPLHRVTP